MNTISLIMFSAFSVICFFAELYEITFDVDVKWSDHLHNLLDHVMFIVVNLIGYQVVNNGSSK